MMKGLIIFFLLILLIISCERIYSLDGFLYGPTEVDEYLRTEDLQEWDARLIIPDSLVEPVVLTSMGNSIYGFFIKGTPDSSENNQITILYCKGKDDNINREWCKMEHLWEMGYNVFLFDYQGYGRSEGSPSDEALYSDGEVSLSYIQSRPDVDTDNIVIYGWSLGTFVAVYLASEVYRPAALILESAPASITALLHDSALLNLPGYYVADADFDSEKRISEIGCPLFMMHGKEDSFVVLERNFLPLWEKAGEPKDSLLVDNAQHSDILHILGNEYHRGIIGFIDQQVLNP
jgi:fermentation-respiration switch protein FrsA (DUF1100 family)